MSVSRKQKSCTSPTTRTNVTSDAIVGSCCHMAHCQLRKLELLPHHIVGGSIDRTQVSAQCSSQTKVCRNNYIICNSPPRGSSRLIGQILVMTAMKYWPSRCPLTTGAEFNFLAYSTAMFHLAFSQMSLANISFIFTVNYLFIKWLRTSLESFLGFVMSSSSSFIGRFMKAVLVGAKQVQGPAVRRRCLC